MIFRVDSYQVIPARRELRAGDQLQRLPRRVFDAIVYLIERRDRAVSKDELIAHVWKRTNVSDVQLNQLVVRARRALGDNGQLQKVIRTVPGFGYRWIAPVDAVNECADEIAHEKTTPPAIVDVAEIRWNRKLIFTCALGVLVAASVIFGFLRFSPAQSPKAPRIAVLPTEGGDAPESAWIRLGIMDLIASHLREGGLAVAPSESVLALLGKGRPDGAREDSAAFRDRAGVELVLETRAARTASGWSIHVHGIRSGGGVVDAAADGRTPVEAALSAGDRVLDALGPHTEHSEEGPPAVREIAQRATAAYLMNELATARAILASAPAEMRSHPLLQLESAQIAMRAGEFEAARSILRGLLAPQARTNAVVRANCLISLGSLELRRGADADAEQAYRTAIDTLSALAPHPHLLGKALMGLGASHIGMRRLDAAASELMRAKDLLEYAGDGLAVARAEANLASLQALQGVYAEALPLFTHAATQFERYGAYDDWAFCVEWLLIANAQLLRWPDARAASDAAARVVEKIIDPALRASVELNRARVMLGLGRLREAEDLIAAADVDDLPADRAEFRAAQMLKGVMALARGDTVRTETLARDLLTRTKIPEFWQEQYEFAAMLYMKGLGPGRVGTLEDLRLAHLDKIEESRSFDKLSPTLATAYAEWLRSRHDYARAESVLRAALHAAQTKAPPEDIAMLVQSLSDLLLATHRAQDAREVVAAVALWADQDFNCAVLRARLYKAEGYLQEFSSALSKARALAGERALPADLQLSFSAGRYITSRTPGISSA